MNEMIERMKYAICGVYMMGDYDADRIARNILKVMREPTQEMEDAAQDSLMEGSSAYGCWQAMIDKALE